MKRPRRRGAAWASPIRARWPVFTNTTTLSSNTLSRNTLSRNTSSSNTNSTSNKSNTSSTSLIVFLILLICDQVTLMLSQQPNESNLKFDPQTSSYKGLTFTFDPRLDKQVEQRLHFEHWQQIMQQTSSLLYDSLNGRAHLGEVQVLIPYKWRQLGAEPLRPVLYKPGAPVITNRRLRFTDSDVIVGLEDPIYKETPYAMQHDECGRPGLNIRMPISFLDQQQQQQQQPGLSSGSVVAASTSSVSQSQQLDSRLKARQFVREFASHRFGVFKESGFRSDFMYPPFSSVAGLSPIDATPPYQTVSSLARRFSNSTSQHNVTETRVGDEQAAPSTDLRGFDEHFQECKFETSPASGLPANAQAANCLPYLVKLPSSITSFNLMSSDPFSYVDTTATTSGNVRPIQWLELAEQTKWHFCGENFINPNYSPLATTLQLEQQQQQQQQQVSGAQSAQAQKVTSGVHFEHNQRATNKQNKMCNERSALDVIKSSDDFRNHQQSSAAANFNRLPAPNFRFLQEMPPRLIMCIEYTSHLFQSRRLDHAILESAINKFLALDLIAESELATVVFGQHSARQLDTSAGGFQRLDSSLSSRLTLFNPALDPFDEQVAYFSQAELDALNIQSSAGGNSGDKLSSSPLKLLKGSCSFARMMAEVDALLAKSSTQYDDLGADVLVLTSGLFVESEAQIEEIIKGSNFKLDQNRLNMILYPSTMLFDTKSRDGYIVLDSVESESIIRSRLAKLLTIQRLTQAKLHLIREQLDSSGDVRMSTLMQFYQIFDNLAKGHSWDQTQSLIMLQSAQVDSRQQPAASVSASAVAPPGGNYQQQHEYKLNFQFQLDDSIQNELFVGFIDPKVQQQHLHQQHLQQVAPAISKAGKRFSLKNLQLRSPSGQLVFSETSTHWSSGWSAALAQPANQSAHPSAGYAGNEEINDVILQQQQPPDEPALESAFFPYRAQLSLAGFHVRHAHLARLQAVKRLAGTWTLTATSDTPIQTSGLAMARVNPAGDTLTGNCWVQTYYSQADSQDAQSPLKMVKVFMQTQGGRRSQELSARMEVQDEMGNIVQNVQMLDDGLGAPDMTQNDGVHSQYVQRATRSGFYKVAVELTTAGSSAAYSRSRSASAQSSPPSLVGQSGQDNVCCGSFVPSQPTPANNSQQQQQQQYKSTRQLYCGTFYVEPTNKLAQQRPPRTSNLTVVSVDQDNRRVTIRWFEPQLDISSSQRLATFGSAAAAAPQSSGQLVSILSDNDLQGEETLEAAATSAGRATRSTSNVRSKRRQAQGIDQDEPEPQDDINYHSAGATTLLGSNNVLIASHQQPGSLKSPSGSGLLVDQIVGSPARAPATSVAAASLARYDIKLFTDRDIIKRAFDSKHEIGFKFNEWNVEGTFPNASQFGGMKEVTLRVPIAREGFYYIAMKTHNNIGLSSQMSNIVQFYLRNNLTLEEFESIYGQPGSTVDAEGNVYDANGVLLQRAGAQGPSNQLNSGYSLLRGTGALDGLSVLIIFSVLAFMMTILCITLVACLASSARHSLKAANKQRAADGDLGGLSNNSSKGKGAGSNISSIVLPSSGGGGGGSGSSVVSSSGGCESSEAGVCSAASSLAGSDQQHGQQVRHVHETTTTSHENKLLFEELTSYNKLRQVHKSQQQQAHLIHQQLISTSGNSLAQSNIQQQQQQHDFYSQPQQQYYGNGPEHTVVNGYTYATVMQAQQQQQHYQQQQQQQQHYGDMNQNGLGQQQLSADSHHLIPTSSAIAQPVQSWPAEILLSHYDKVKQARERNEAPPVMRVETLEHNNGLQYSDGLPTVLEDQHLVSGNNKSMGCSYSQPRQSTKGNQQPAVSYLNQQLQQQLSSVLAGKRQSQEYDIDIRGTSPALEGVTGSELGGSNTGSQQGEQASQHQQQLIGMPPPPQYIYCTPAGGAPIDTNGLGSQLTDPSIYSQATNLQQVPSSCQSNFYANHQVAQWAAASSPNSSGTAGGQYGSSNIYSAAAMTSQQQQQQQHGDSAISEV